MHSDRRPKMKGGAFPGDHICAAPDCQQAGAYRAPRHRPGESGSGKAAPADGGRWQYFCLDHVRAFNAGWNYFDGMSAEEIWRAQTPHPGWDREARAFARTVFTAGPDRVEDALGVLRWKTADAGRPVRLGREDRQALACLGLGDEATMAEVKAKFRQLARRYHPDANAGRRDHEAHFQRLTEAVAHLTRSASFNRR